MKSALRLALLRFAHVWALSVLLSLTGCDWWFSNANDHSGPSVVSIEVTPANPSIAAGTTIQLMATAIYSDNTHLDVTKKANWVSTTPDIASVSNTSGSNGEAAGAAVGKTLITATFGGTTSPPLTLAVTSAALVSIAVTPAAPTVATGMTQQFIATGTFTDSTNQDLTRQVTWASDAPSVATISNDSLSIGLATVVGQGTANISATLGSVSGSAALTGVQPTSFTTPGSYTWTVPANVTSIQVVVTGGGGGGGGSGNGPGGNGGVVTATLSVSPGDVLDIEVGGGGATDSVTGGGGGASSVNAGTTNQVVAGGGGGAGGGCCGVVTAQGGDGGGAGTGAGASGSSGASYAGLGGDNGIGGAGGVGDFMTGANGGSGNGGPGGAGGSGAAGGSGSGTGTGGDGANDCCGGGGGGGYGGGGGSGSGEGADGGGGGGGSVGPAGSVYSVSTNGGAATPTAGGDGSVLIIMQQ